MQPAQDTGHEFRGAPSTGFVLPGHFVLAQLLAARLPARSFFYLRSAPVIASGRGLLKNNLPSFQRVMSKMK